MMHTIQPTKSRRTSPMMPVKAPALTRELLATNSAAIIVSNDEPDVRLSSDAERRASLEVFMQTRPVGDLWIFAYGSLVWNPALRVAERRVAEVRGWHRSFCLSMAVGRGTSYEPGLALGLDRGGACEGVAYRIAERDIASELPILWSREMLIGGYNPIWTDVFDDGGERFGAAIAFTIDRAHNNYAGVLPQHEKVRRLATAEGSWGSSADYIYRTIEALRAHDIRDVEMERLGDMVDSANRKKLKEAA